MGEWYVSPSIAYTDDDPDRKVDDSFSGGQVQVGREMGEHLWLEGLFGYHDIDGFPGQERPGDGQAPLARGPVRLSRY
jgi:hypothetical protein